MNNLQMLEHTMKSETSIEPTIKDHLTKCISSGQSKKLLRKEMEAEYVDKLNEYKHVTSCRMLAVTCQSHTTFLSKL